MESFDVTAIAHVSSPRTEPVDDGWARVESTIGLTPAFGPDAVDGTPVLDIKPCLREFAPRGEVREPAWAEELMADYF